MFQLGVVENMLRLIQLIINREGYHRHIHLHCVIYDVHVGTANGRKKILISSASASIRTAVKANAVVETFFAASRNCFFDRAFESKRINSAQFIYFCLI